MNKVIPPIYPAVPFLSLQDYFIMQIIPKLQALTYIDGNAQAQSLIQNVYPIAERNEESGCPQMFISGNDYADIAPDDRLKSLSFFYLNGAIDMPNAANAFFDFSLFFWFNEKMFGKLNQRLQAVFSQIIVSRCLNDMSNISIYTRPEDVFEYFEYERFMPQTRPYNALRIKFENRLGLPIDCIPPPQMPLITC